MSSPAKCLVCVVGEVKGVCVQCLFCPACGSYHKNDAPHNWATCSVCYSKHNPNHPHRCKICKKLHPRVVRKGVPSMACPKKCVECAARRACKVCNRCLNCGCACRICTGCKKKLPIFCHNCSKCRQCDQCKGRPARHDAPPQLAIVGSANTRVINSLPRTIGLELEFADWKELLNWKGVKWVKAYDSSVRPSGAEMNVMPLSGDALVKACMNIGLACAEFGTTVNDTCGFHVHVDAQDLGWWDIRKLLLVWMGVENAIFGRFIAPSRLLNRYCLPVRKNVSSKFIVALGDLKNISIGMIKSQWVQEQYFDVTNNSGMSIQEVGSIYKRSKSGKYQGPRYHAMNVHSWIHRGTVEFRLHEGTTDGVEMRNWALMCGWIVEAASRMTFQQAMKVHSGGLAALLALTQPSMLDVKPRLIIPPLEARDGFVRKYIMEKMK